MNNVRDFGAVGDGRTLDTAAIQRAIDAGGMVDFPPGTYLAGTLYLKSRGGLHLEPGAVLLASPDRKDYNADDFCPQNAVFSKENVSGAHFIVAVEQEDITICGGGRIDGNRQAFYGTGPKPPLEPRGCFSLGAPESGFWRPGQMIFICECARVRIEGVQLFHAPYWTCFLHGCEDVTVRGLRIWNDPRTPNGDGVDIDCCCRVTVSDCIIDSGDDCITLRGSSRRLKNKRPCEYITISNCVLSTPCNAFRIGVGDGLIRHAAIANIVIHDTRTAICMVPQYSTNSPGVEISDVTVANVELDCTIAFNVATTPRGVRPEAGKALKNIHFRHIYGQARSASIVQGSRPEYVDKVFFSDIRLAMVPGGEARVRPWPHDLPVGEFESKSTQSAFFVQNVKRVAFDQVFVEWRTDDPVWEYGMIVEHAPELTVTGSDFGKPGFSR